MDWQKETWIFFRISLIVVFCWQSVSAQDSTYFFPDQDPRFLPSYQQTRNDYSLSTDDIRRPSYIPQPNSFFQRDLQTSDLPLHLQQTLPQYRYSGLSLTTSEPSGFRFDPESLFQNSPFPRQNSPSLVTQRPSYSTRLGPFGNSAPSRTVKYLRETSLDNSANSPQDTQDYNNGGGAHFRPSLDFSPGRNRPVAATAFGKWSGFKSGIGDGRTEDTTEKVDQSYTGRTGNSVISLGKNTRNNYLNHRTRIFAPNGEAPLKPKPLVKDYFVNSNGDVYKTTKNPFSPKPTSTTPIPSSTPRKNNFRPSFKNKAEPSTIANTTPLPKVVFTPPPKTDSTLNVAVTTKRYVEDDPEVAKPVTVPPDRLFTVNPVSINDDYYDSSAENTTEVYDYEDEPDVDYLLEGVSQNKPSSQTMLQKNATESPTTEELTTDKQEEEASTAGSYNVTTTEMENLTIAPSVTESNIQPNRTEEESATEDLEEYAYYDYEESAENSSKEEDAPKNVTYDDRKDKKLASETASEEVTTEQYTTSQQIAHDDSEDKITVLTTTEEESVVESTTYLPSSVEVEDLSSNQPDEVSHATDRAEVEYTAPSSSSTTVASVSVKEVAEESSAESNYDDNSLQAYEDSEEYLDEGKAIPDSNEIAQEAMKEDVVSGNNSFAVVTMKPAKSVKEENFKDFTDIADMDSTDESILTTNSNEESQIDERVVTTTQKGKSDKVVSVVSVVTTKSVVNNTVVVDTATPIPLTTELMDATPNKEENTTDSWIIIASVQTSRSVSGARYLPAGIVEQEEKTTLVGDINREKKLNEHVEEKSTTEENQTTVAQSPPKHKTSTESLIDKLDRVQSDLSNKYLIRDFNSNNGNNYIITEGKEEDLLGEDPTTTSTTTTTTTTTTTSAPTTTTTIRTTLLPVKIKKFSSIRPSSGPRKLPESLRNKIYQRVPASTEPPKNDQPLDLSSLKGEITVQDVSAFLPPGYKPPSEKPPESSKTLLDELLSKVKIQDPTALLPPDYGEKIKEDNVSSLLPPGYKLPDGSKSSAEVNEKPDIVSQLFKESNPVDISAFLPKDYKPPSTTVRTTAITEKTGKIGDLFEKATPLDISAFLPKDFQLDAKPSAGRNRNSTTSKPKTAMNNTRIVNSPEGKHNKTKSLMALFDEAEQDEVSKFLPAGFKPRFTPPKSTTPPSTTPSSSPTDTTSAQTPSSSPTSKGNSFKLVFPSRPGQNRKTVRSTTPRVSHQNEEIQRSTVTAPTILKSWPTRATTEFTGWPTPSTTPISIEKLLEAAKTASTTASVSSVTTTVTTTTSTTTTTTTTPKPTTPGVCEDECDLVGTIKLVGGAKWVPELLDRNTDEWQILANEVQSQLERVYSRSEKLNKWYKKIRIDGFSEGSVLVDYVVELDDVANRITTTEMKRIFHESLGEMFKSSNREPKSSDLGDKGQEKLLLGNFTVDPVYTDFVVVPHLSPTVGYADSDVLLPQWAIAVVVIGLASLLFVIIFGVTVLVNRQKNNKKRAPIPLTDEMIHELNKNHMGGIDNYGQEDFYNMDDWNDRSFETKPKKKSGGSLRENSMSNLYDSWRSEWNGPYNSYYGNNIGHGHNHSHHPGSNRRRPDYDTNF